MLWVSNALALAELKNHTLPLALQEAFSRIQGFDQRALAFTAAAAGPDDDDHDFRLFRWRDREEWLLFTILAGCLLLFDNAVLHRKNEVLSFSRACVYTLFWIGCAGLFCVWVYIDEGREAAVSWGTGYLLEWMLSVDNLFVFHMVFQMYGTPDHLKHKPLFIGILGALFFRMLFFVIEEWLFHSFWWMHLIFGTFLIYTGIKAATMEGEDEDPTQHPVVQWIGKKLPIIPGYDPGGRFFVRVGIHASSDEPLLSPYNRKNVDWNDLSPRQHEAPRYSRYKATLLVLVVVCLEATDIVFAVDSISAIVAQVPDLYLAYTACVFAMLGLRATFFIIDELIRMFTLLKYGVAFILVFIGARLLVSKMVHISSTVVLLILIGTLSTCMLASILIERWKQDLKQDEQPEQSPAMPGAVTESQDRVAGLRPPQLSLPV